MFVGEQSWWSILYKRCLNCSLYQLIHHQGDRVNVLTETIARKWFLIDDFSQETLKNCFITHLMWLRAHFWALSKDSWEHTSLRKTSSMETGFAGHAPVLDHASNRIIMATTISYRWDHLLLPALHPEGWACQESRLADLSGERPARSGATSPGSPAAPAPSRHSSGLLSAAPGLAGTPPGARPDLPSPAAAFRPLRGIASPAPPASALAPLAGSLWPGIPSPIVPSPAAVGLGDAESWPAPPFASPGCAASPVPGGCSPGCSGGAGDGHEETAARFLARGAFESRSSCPASSPWPGTDKGLV